MPFFIKSTVGLYIGARSVQLAHLQNVAGKMQLVNFVHVDIYEEEQKASASNKEDLIVNALRKAINKSKIDVKRVNTILMPGMVLLRYFQMPKIPPEELEEAVKFEARKYIPFPLEEAVTGFFILKEEHESRKLGILSLVTKEESIKSHLTILNRAGIHPTYVETASFSLLRLLEHSGELDKAGSNVVLYLYSKRLNIIILKNCVPYFVRDVSLSKKEEWIDDQTAEILMGDNLSATDMRVVSLENIISEMRISLEYYKKELGRDEINKVILCGELDDFDDLDPIIEVAKDNPDSQCPLATYLQNMLDIPVTTIDPLKDIQMPKVKPLPYTYAALPVTIGAGLRGLAKFSVEIDLFRARKKTSIRTKIFIKKMLIGGTIGLIACFIALFIAFSVFVSREKNLLDAEKRKAPKFIDLSQFKDSELKKGMTEIRDRAAIFTSLVARRVVLTEKLSELPALIPPEIWLSSLQFKVSSPADRSRKGLNRKVSFELNGYIYTEQKGWEIELVNDFSEKLKTSNKFFRGFKVIKTGSATRADYEGVQVMSFSLTCLSEAEED